MNFGRFSAIPLFVILLIGMSTKEARAQKWPTSMTVCEDKNCDAGNGATVWSFHDDKAQEGNGGQLKVVTLERFDTGGISIRRQDSPNGAFGTEPNTIFVGHFYGDFMSGTMTRHQDGKVIATGVWQGVTSPTNCQGSETPEVAKFIGSRAIKIKQNVAALKCYEIGAQKGDAEAETMAGLLLHAGLGIPHDQSAAFSWLTKAANANDYKGELALSVMYQRGLGTAADMQKAVYWISKAEKQKEEAQAAAARKDVIEMLAVSAVVVTLLAADLDASNAESSQQSDAQRRDLAIRNALLDIWARNQHDWAMEKAKKDPNGELPFGVDPYHPRSH